MRRTKGWSLQAMAAACMGRQPEIVSPRSLWRRRSRHRRHRADRSRADDAARALRDDRHGLRGGGASHRRKLDRVRGPGQHPVRSVRRRRARRRHDAVQGSSPGTRADRRPAAGGVARAADPGDGAALRGADRIAARDRAAARPSRPGAPRRARGRRVARAIHRSAQPRPAQSARRDLGLRPADREEARRSVGRRQRGDAHRQQRAPRRR